MTALTSRTETKHTTLPVNILIFDDDEVVVNSLKEFLEEEGYRSFPATRFAEAKRYLESEDVQLVITDLNMPELNGLEFLQFLNRHFPKVATIVITAYGSVDSAVSALKMGAHDYITKPIDDDELRASIQRAVNQQRLLAENVELKEKLKKHEQFDELIGQDRKIQKVFRLIEAVAPTSTTVLITGESGTGKSVVARKIHLLSPRADKPFVEVSCGAIPETLLESELFGHIKGSFTGAVADKTGRFLSANGGTIFLDEIDSASPALQVKLLRVLQERQFEPVGSNETVTVDVRVIVATNKDLKQLVGEGKFRQDLYYRINVINIHLPSLRERLSDIPLLVEYFLDKFKELYKRPNIKISNDALNYLTRYHWPGNIRELENVIERAVVLALSDTIEIHDLPNEIIESVPAGTNLITTTDTLAGALRKAERKIILDALDRHNWNRQMTARALGISRTSLFRKMKELNIVERNEKVY